MMTLNATGCRSAFIHPFDWTLTSNLAAAKLLDAQYDSEKHLVAQAQRVWLEMDGEEGDLDSSEVRKIAQEMLEMETADEEY